MRVVNQAVEDGVGVGRTADQLMPLVDGDLAGQDRRTPAVAFLDDLAEIVASTSIKGFEAPVIEDQQLRAVRVRRIEA